MKFATCPQCGAQRIIVGHHDQTRFRRHGTTDTNGKRITCPGSLQPPPPHTPLKEV